MDTSAQREISDQAAMILAVIFTLVIVATVVIPIILIK